MQMNKSRSSKTDSFSTAPLTIFQDQHHQIIMAVQLTEETLSKIIAEAAPQFINRPPTYINSNPLTNPNTNPLTNGRCDAKLSQPLMDDCDGDIIGSGLFVPKQGHKTQGSVSHLTNNKSAIHRSDIFNPNRTSIKVGRSNWIDCDEHRDGHRDKNVTPKLSHYRTSSRTSNDSENDGHAPVRRSKSRAKRPNIARIMTVSPTESISPRCVRRQRSDGSNRSKSKDKDRKRRKFKKQKKSKDRKDRDQRYQQMKRERDRQLEGDHNLIHEHQPGNQSNSTKDHHPNFSMAVNQGSTYNVNEVEFSSNRLEDEALSGLDTKIRCSAYTAFKTSYFVHFQILLIFRFFYILLISIFFVYRFCVGI